jgi:hypothetical protein
MRPGRLGSDVPSFAMRTTFYIGMSPYMYDWAAEVVHIVGICVFHEGACGYAIRIAKELVVWQ